MGVVLKQGTILTEKEITLNGLKKEVSDEYYSILCLVRKGADNNVLTEKTTRLFDCDEVTAHLKIAETLLTYGDFIDNEEARQVIPFNS